jgi:hypothetical protein
MKCLKCKKEIEIDECVYELRWGRYVEDDMGGRYHKEASHGIHGYIHYKCLENGIRDLQKETEPEGVLQDLD